MGLVHAETADFPGNQKQEIVVHTARTWNSIVAFLSPFRLIGLDGEDQWQARKGDECIHVYDYVKLNRISGSIAAHIDGEKTLHLGFDGSVILTHNYCTSLDEATSIFNEFLGRLLFGGVYCEAIEQHQLSRAILMENGYARLVDSAVTARGTDHAQLRMGHASVIDLGALWKPDMERFDDLDSAYRMGEQIFRRVEPVSAAFVIQGITALVRRNFASALINLWTVSEQCIEILWKRNVVLPARSELSIDGRLDALRDSRTWTSSVKLELLFQKSLVDPETYACVSKARKSRNKLVHDGLIPNVETVDAAADGTLRLMSLVSTRCNRADEFLGALAHFRAADGLRTPIKPQVVRREDLGPEGGYFVRIPPIPGERQWEKEKATYPYSVTVMQLETSHESIPPEN